MNKFVFGFFVLSLRLKSYLVLPLKMFPGFSKFLSGFSNPIFRMSVCHMDVLTIVQFDTLPSPLTE